MAKAAENAFIFDFGRCCPVGVIKDKNIKRLSELLSPDNNGGGSFSVPEKADSLKSLYESLLKTDDKKERSRLMADFRKRNTEFADFIAKNPELLKAELERAVIMSAVGGAFDETEITVDGRGRRKIKRTRKQAAPNAAAALRYLEKTSPEIWGDNASGKPPENNLFEILKVGLSGDADVSEKESEGEG